MKNYFDIKDKVAVVTGSSSGLGLQMAKALASQGVKLALFARREERLQENKKEIEEEFGTEVIYAVTDVTDVENIQESVKKVVDHYGRIDILINSAGMGNNKMVMDQPTEEWRQHIEVDLSGVYYCCKEVGKVMIEQNYGKIINIGSIHSRVIFPGGGISAYSAAKGGVMNLTKNLAVEWAKYNITCNAIGPAVFATELTQESVDMDGFMDLIQAYCPMGRLGEPGELDGLAIYLASDASSFCTGQLICVDGGWTAI
ncbi:SDR family NAD(P)-dependent oxidoreductase [Methanosphaera sp. WGK6]|uniref:SDR family NAD(P)-dependent oxidoreductase n=1 Tax=Methanosphaera sp. WGK6 TaxID=1561964 RepID=UPI00084CB435|nr:SDR family oxidoreductase [Methanosphaera sp. WGK6]OED29563.1 short-chain dehydrogenase [Methanosphaera sp. WGK6]